MTDFFYYTPSYHKEIRHGTLGSAFCALVRAGIHLVKVDGLTGAESGMDRVMVPLSGSIWQHTPFSPRKLLFCPLYILTL